MRSVLFTSASVATLAFQLAAAQTYTTCNPMNKTCPADLGLGSTQNIDFTTGESSAFKATSIPIKYGSKGAEFTISKKGDAPTIQSNAYIFFGHVDVVMQCSPGVGIVSTIVLESDDLDEVDWEALGGDGTQIQTNYFGKGNTTSYDRGGFSAVTSPQTQFHTYGLDWTKDRLQWSIDGVVTRTLNYADAVGGKNYPQTPMNVRIGTWAAGDSGNAPGTIQWAGGKTDYSAGPYTGYVKSVMMVDFSTGACYTYGDMTGDYTSIKALSSGDAACANTDKGKSPDTSSSAVSGSASASATASASAAASTLVTSSKPSTTSTGSPALGSIINGPFATTSATVAPSSGAGNGTYTNGTVPSGSGSASPPAATKPANSAASGIVTAASTLMFGLTLAVAFAL